VCLPPTDALLPSGRINFALLAQIHDQHIAGTASAGCMPLWISSPTPRGRAAFNFLFRRRALNNWGLQLDKKNLTVDPRLQKLNQPALLIGLCGESSWKALLIQDKLWSGLQCHYQGKGRMFSVFSENFPWAFDEETPGHLHYNDFPHEDMYLDITEDGPVWNWLDHIIRIDLGIVLYNPQTGQLDQRLLPENRGQFAKEHGYANWTALEEKTGLAGILRFSPKAEGSRTRSGSLGKLLAWHCPLAFDPQTKGYFEISDFDYSSIDNRQDENKKLLLHIMAKLGLNEQSFTRRVTRQILLNEGFPITQKESVLEVFCRYFEGIAPEFLFAEIETNGNQSWFKLGGKVYSFPAQALVRCLLAKQGSKDYIIIYARPARRVIGKNDPAAKYIIKTSTPNELLEAAPELLAAMRKEETQPAAPTSHFFMARR